MRSERAKGTVAALRPDRAEDAFAASRSYHAEDTVAVPCGCHEGSRKEVEGAGRWAQLAWMKPLSNRGHYS